MKIKNKILVVCHDAGGAEIISAYIKKNSQKHHFFCYLAGPAKRIFQRKHINAACLPPRASSLTISRLFKKHSPLNALMVGTSWASFIEFDFLQKAKMLGIKTIVYLDHWVNYRERFGYPRMGWKKNLPDEIWVGDKYAYSMAKESFKGGKMLIKLVPNLYFEEIKKDYKEIKQRISGSPDHILFMSEPLSSFLNCFGDKQGFKYSEFDVLDKFLSYLAKKKIKNKVVILPHPSEKKDKYSKILAKYADKLKLIPPNSQNLIEEIAKASLVVGMQGMALIVACLCDKTAISFIPDSNTDCSLPFDNILKIKRVEELNKIITWHN